MCVTAGVPRRRGPRDVSDRAGCGDDRDRRRDVTGFDLVAMGRTGVDIYPLEHGVGLEDVQTFQKFLGGSATNVAVAAARYGRRTALVTRTGQDPFGRYVRIEAERLGVDPAFITAGEGPPTPVTFCEVFPPDDFPLYFYRYPRRRTCRSPRPTCRWRRSATPRCSGRPSPDCPRSPRRAAHAAAWEARARRRHTILDLDYRPMFWADPPKPPRRSARRWSTSPSPSGTVRSARSRSGRPTRSVPPTRCSSAASRSPSSSRAPGGCWR